MQPSRPTWPRLVRIGARGTEAYLAGPDRGLPLPARWTGRAPRPGGMPPAVLGHIHLCRRRRPGDPAPECRLGQCGPSAGTLRTGLQLPRPLRRRHGYTAHGDLVPSGNAGGWLASRRSLLEPARTEQGAVFTVDVEEGAAPVSFLIPVGKAGVSPPSFCSRLFLARMAAVTATAVRTGSTITSGAHGATVPVHISIDDPSIPRSIIAPCPRSALVSARAHSLVGTIRGRGNGSPDQRTRGVFITCEECKRTYDRMP